MVFRVHSEILSPCTRRPRKAHVSCNGNNRRISFTTTTKKKQIVTADIINLHIICLYLGDLLKLCENIIVFYSDWSAFILKANYAHPGSSSPSFNLSLWSVSCSKNCVIGKKDLKLIPSWRNKHAASHVFLVFCNIFQLCKSILCTKFMMQMCIHVSIT